MQDEDDGGIPEAVARNLRRQHQKETRKLKQIRKNIADSLASDFDDIASENQPPRK